MKKNITINLCGRLYQIDEDAYELLQHYIESLRSSFGRQEGGDEIVDDIEARVSELFDELKHQGIEAITIDHVKDIITRIGEPEQLAGEESEDKSGEKEGHRYDSFRSAASGFREQLRVRTAGKRLYRNPNDKMLAGVLSGFAAYTGTDATLWRLGFLALVVLGNPMLWGILRLFHMPSPFISVNLSWILFYIILAIAMPEAKQPKEVLQMKGKEVTPQTLADVVVEDQRPPEQKGQMRGCLSVLMKMLVGLFVAIAAIFGFALLVCFLLIVGTLIFVFTVPGGNSYGLPFDIGYLHLSETIHMHPWAVVIFIVSLLLTLFIPLYAITHLLLSKAGKVQPMGTSQRIGWIVFWLAALLAIFPSIGVIHSFNDWQRQEQKADRLGWTTDYAREYLDKHHLWVENRRLCHSDYVKSGQYFTGDSTVAYIDVKMWGDEDDRCFQLSSQEEEVDAGIYRISCNVRVDGGGVCLFAIAHDGSLKATSVVSGNDSEGGNIWEEAADMVKSDSLPLAERARKIREANDGKGYGWSHNELDVEIYGPTTLRYGISTDPEFTEAPCHATWFSAADFKLTRIGDLQKQ